MIISEIPTYLIKQGYPKAIRERKNKELLISFFQVIGKPLTKTGCQSCLSKAYFNLRIYRNYDFSRTQKAMRYKFINPKTKYRARELNSRIITEENLTDEIAEKLIRFNPARKSMFVITEVEEAPVKQHETKVKVFIPEVENKTEEDKPKRTRKKKKVNQ